MIPLAYFGALFAWGAWDFVAGDPVVVIYQLLALAYLAAMGAVYLLPERGEARARGSERDRWVALASANLLIPLSLLPPREVIPYPALMAALGAANLLSWWALLTLRSSFSLTPEARRLVTGGPYRYVRHPLYTAGLLIGVALTAGSWSWAAIALFLLYAAVTVVRAHAEERVLRRAFPDAYADYAARVPAFLPRLSPSRRYPVAAARSTARRD